MFRSLRSVLLVALGLVVLMRLLDRWSESRLAATPWRSPVPPQDGPDGARMPAAAPADTATVPWTLPVLAEAPAAGEDEVATRLREANEAVRRLNETFAEIAAASDRPLGPLRLRPITGRPQGPEPAQAVAVAEQAVALMVEEPEVEQEQVVTPAAPVVTGTFSITGAAVGPGHVVWSQVLFGDRLATAPTGWAREDGQVWSPGTLVLDVTGSMNCTPDDIGVVFAIGHSPTPDSFTVRITCAQAGPFAAVGTYRVV